MKRVLFIGTGGTISCINTENGLTPSLDVDALINTFPHIKKLCDPYVYNLYNLDSSLISTEHWLGIAKTIENNYNDYDAFIVCHGTDTMAYSAAALSYLIQNSSKPIIFTGSQKPISYDITDAKKNLNDSVLCAIHPDSAGVCVVFDSKIICGSRARKEKTYSFDAFASINFPILGYIRDEQVIYHIKEKINDPVQFFNKLDARIFVFKAVPGMPIDIIDTLMSSCDAIIIECFGMGGIPKNIADKIIEAKKNHSDCLIILTTQVAYEGSDVGVYEVGRYLDNKFDYLEARDMTPEALYTKTMWILSNYKSKEDIKKAFYTPVGYDTFGYKI